MDVEKDVQNQDEVRLPKVTLEDPVTRVLKSVLCRTQRPIVVYLQQPQMPSDSQPGQQRQCGEAGRGTDGEWIETRDGGFREVDRTTFEGLGRRRTDNDAPVTVAPSLERA